MIVYPGCMRVAVGVLDVAHATNRLLLAAQAAQHPSATKAGIAAVDGVRKTLVNTVNTFLETINKAEEL